MKGKIESLGKWRKGKGKGRGKATPGPSRPEWDAVYAETEKAIHGIIDAGDRVGARVEFVGGFVVVARGGEHEQVIEVGFGSKDRLLEVLRRMTATVDACDYHVNF